MRSLSSPGVSDAVDGFLAKRFNMASELGALLDPLADKALLVSIYVALGIWGAVPRWIVILVVSRDIMIVGAVIVSWLFGKPIPMKPLMVSKLNTAAQVAFAALVLAALGFGFNSAPYDLVLMGLVTIFTLVSVSLYLVEWVRHMSTIERRLNSDRWAPADVRHGVTAWQAAFNLVSLHWRCRTPKASPATIFSKAPPMQPGWRWSTAGPIGPTGSCCWSDRKVPARAISPPSGPSRPAPARPARTR